MEKATKKAVHTVSFGSMSNSVGEPIERSK